MKLPQRNPWCGRNPKGTTSKTADTDPDADVISITTTTTASLALH
ncbi:MAG: hypothetical protein R6U13_07340 [Desulfatiglandaceae bacterium]